MSYCVLLLSSTLSLLLSFRRVPNGMSQSLEEIPNPAKGMKVCKINILEMTNRKAWSHSLCEWT